jgi:hypothetical protein
VDITDGNVFPDEMEVDLGMLHTLMPNEVGGEVDGANIVTVDKSAIWQQSMELLEELPEPTSFNHAIGHNAIFSIDARPEDDVLTLGGPEVEVVAEEHSVARGGPTCIRATRPVHIRVDHQLGGGVKVA